MTDTRVMTVGTVMVDLLAVDLPNVAEPGRVIYAPIESRIGGHPVDVAIDLVKMGFPARSVAMVAAVGEGTYGSFVEAVMNEYSFRTYLQRVSSHDTGRNLVLGVTGEDRRFHMDPGANWYLDADHVTAALADFAPHVLSLRPGYTGIDFELTDLLRPLVDTLVLCDVMQPHPDRPSDLVIPALPFVDIVHCNEGEALTVTGAATIDEAVGIFLDGGVAMMLVTSGERGARVVTNRYDVVQSGFHVPTVDPTGCGDAFCAGAIEWLTRFESPPARSTLGSLGSDDLTDLLAHAQSVGASAATKPGCVEGVSKEGAQWIWSEQSDRVLLNTHTRRR